MENLHQANPQVIYRPVQDANRAIRCLAGFRPKALTIKGLLQAVQAVMMGLRRKASQQATYKLMRLANLVTVLQLRFLAQLSSIIVASQVSVPAATMALKQKVNLQVTYQR